MRTGLKAMALVSAFLIAITATATADDLDPADREQLASFASATWRSIEAFKGQGVLPADELRHEGTDWTKAGLTSPTDIAAYLWSAVAARDLDLISAAEATRRLEPLLANLTRLERSHGFYFNWYESETGQRAQTWPGGGVVRPFLSSVDNGWLAMALMLVGNTFPELQQRTEALLKPMDFAFFYDPYDPKDPVKHPGLLHGGYWTDDESFTGFHYGLLNTEPRIASYVGIARGNLPSEHYFRMSRAGHHPHQPSTNPPRVYDGVAVASEAIQYRGREVVPSWDGTMFEALMVPLFVPEAEWGPKSWGINHPRYVRSQIEYAIDDARLGHWGISASCDPVGGYRAFGAAPLGVGEGTRSWSVGRGVITPHASFLALPYAPREAMANLKELIAAFPGVYGPFGFFDAVDVLARRVSDRMLLLDQAMILAASANALRDKAMSRHFSDGMVEATIRPLIARESFFDQDAGLAIRSNLDVQHHAVGSPSVTERPRNADPMVPGPSPGREDRGETGGRSSGASP